MAESSIPKHGEICWRELATIDLKKALDFYSQLFSWHLEQTKATQMDYKEIHLDGTAYGGMMEINESWDPTPPHWTTYIAVDNADYTAEQIKQNGGSIRVAPFDAPGVGRISLVADPAGANFAIIQFAQQ